MLLQRQNNSSNPLLIEAARRAIERRRQVEAKDPVLLAQRAGLDLDPWQCDVLRSLRRQKALNVTRQGGKSTVAAVKALHKAEYEEGSLTLLLAPTERQSGELFRKVREVYAAAPGLSRLSNLSALRMEFQNGSRIVALPGKEETIRGFSGVALLVVDEASRVSDALYNSVRPMLAVSGGEIALLSTPWGKQGFFFDVWEKGGPEWERTMVTAYQCPRIPREWLELERQMLGEFWFDQEYCCVFQDNTSAVFRYEDIQAAMSGDLEPQWGLSSVFAR